jgi:hypothetical protein
MVGDKAYFHLNVSFRHPPIKGGENINLPFVLLMIFRVMITSPSPLGGEVG